jgi:hypothetical protein
LATAVTINPMPEAALWWTCSAAARSDPSACPGY